MIAIGDFCSSIGDSRTFTGGFCSSTGDSRTSQNNLAYYTFPTSCVAHHPLYGYSAYLRNPLYSLVIGLDELNGRNIKS